MIVVSACIQSFDYELSHFLYFGSQFMTVFSSSLCWYSIGSGVYCRKFFGYHHAGCHGKWDFNHRRSSQSISCIYVAMALEWYKIMANR